MPDLQVIARPHALQAARFVGGIQAGLTLAEIVVEIHKRGNVRGAARAGAVVMVNGEIIPPDMWSRVKPKPSAHVMVSMPLHGGGGGGGKNPLATVLTLAAVVVAAVAAGPLAYSLASSVGAGWTTAGGAFIASAGFMSIATPLIAGTIVMGGALLANSLFPVRQQSIGLASPATSSPTYSVSGSSNSANKFGAVPVILGRMKHTPPLGAQTYTEIVGNDEYLRMLLIWGYGPLKIEDIKIGDTSIDEFDDVEIETREGRTTDAPLTLYPSSVLQKTVGAALTNDAGWITRAAPAAADELSVDNIFASGLASFNSDGGTSAYSVQVEIEYRLIGSETWLPAINGVSTVTYSDATIGAVRYGHRWKVTRGDYEIRQRRVTADSDSTQIIDDLTWSALRTFRAEQPVKFPYPLAMTALRIKATDQLSGVIQDLSAIVTSYAPVWNGADWSEEAATQNPAALARLVLTGPANERRRSVDQMDDSFADFFEFCADNDFCFNMVRDSQASVWDTITDICSSARAAPTLIDGKWGVIMDVADKPVVQHFTPRNSWGFQGEITLTDFPHAWRVPFKDETNDYQDDEAFVFADGYDRSNATKYESLTVSGLTRFSDVWRQGRYRHAQIRLRPETYKFKADFEHLVCQRGDHVVSGHDVPQWGAAWGRVKSLIIDEDDKLSGVVLDERVTMEDGKSYAVRFRLADGSGPTFSLVTAEGETDTLTLLLAVPVSDGPEVGDLAMFGEAERVVVDLLVKAIRPADDLTAEIELEDYAPEIYNADTGEIPAWTPHVTKQASVTTLKPQSPAVVSVQSGTAALVVTADGGFRARMLVSVSASGGTPRTAKLRLRYRPAGASAWAVVEASGVNATLIADPVTEGAIYEYQAQAESIYGVPSLWSDVATETIIGQSEPPPNPAGYRVNVVGGTAYHSWNPSDVIDLDHARIRWTPAALSEAKWGSAVDVVERVGLPATSTATPVLVGTYLLKFVDHAGNESLVAAAATTGVVAVQNLNFIEAMEEGPDEWEGTFSDTAARPDLGGLALAGAPMPLLTRVGDSILLSSGDALAVRGARELVGEGIYELPGAVDLGGVFTARLSAILTTSGFDAGSALSLLASDGSVLVARDGAALIARNPADVADGAWNVAMDIATTNDDPGEPGASWSDWTPITVGDYSARAVKARLRLRGSPPSVTPVVERARLVVDMEDRIIPFSADVPEGGASVAFDPEFFVTPEIGLSIANGQEGDAYTMSKNPSSMTIAFTNGGAPVARSISGIAKAYGARI